MDIKQADLINVLEGALGSALYAGIFAMLLRPYSYIKFLNKKSVEKEYSQYIYFKDKPIDLTNLFLDKISRCLSLAALWMFALVMYLSPIWHVSRDFKLTGMSLITTVFSMAVIFVLAKPINLRQAIIDPKRYERRVIRKLGKFPDNIAPKA